jgi:pyruvate formate lyase activating enzyme
MDHSMESGGKNSGRTSGGRGTVFNATKYMLEDGPGIRTVVFLKGCPLRCLWCSSPLCQTPEPSLVYLKHKCISCQACLPACPEQALFLDEEGKIGRNFEKCVHCGNCAKVCPAGAREMRGSTMTVEEVLEKVGKDRVFYRRGGGGVTLSGGEVLMQPAFTANILKRCWEKLIHTAIETCAFGRWEDLRAILTYTNLAFIDIKHADPAAHKKLTGRSNRVILDNIRKAAAYFQGLKRHLIVRLAVVPGINDSLENLRGIADFLKGLPGGWELNLLPYHKYGISKYDWLGMEYKLVDVEPPSRDRLLEMVRYFESLGVLCSLGGAEIRSLTV